MSQDETDLRSSFVFVLTAAFVRVVSRSLSSEHRRQLSFTGALDQIHSGKWQVRILSARHDEIWGRDVQLQKRMRTLLLPEPDLLSEDDLLALTLSRMERLGFQVPWAGNLSLALDNANRRLRASATRWAARTGNSTKINLRNSIPSFIFAS